MYMMTGAFPKRCSISTDASWCGALPMKSRSSPPFLPWFEGRISRFFPQLIDEFRFYTPYITRFFDEQGKLLAAYQPVQRFPVSLSQLQPSQFYVDRDKVTAIATFVRSWEDIVISVLPMGERYIALDGHTRLYYAVSKHWDQVYAVCHTVDDSIYDFVREAKRRGITSPQDLELLEHEEYDTKWNHYCDNYFSGKFT